MSVRKLILPGLAAGRQVIDLPTSNSIDNLIIENADFAVGNVKPTLAQWATYISRIEILIDGHAVWNISMAFYVMLLERKNVTIENGTLPILFTRPGEDTLELRAHGRLGTRDLKTLQLALTFEAASLPINSFDLRATFGANEPIGQFIGYVERPINIASIGVADLKGLPDQKNYATHALYWDVDTFEEIEVRVGETPVDETAKVTRLQQDRLNGLTAVAGFDVLDFARRGDLREIFPMKSKDIIIRVNDTAASGNKTMLQEYIQNFSKVRRPLA